MKEGQLELWREHLNTDKDKSVSLKTCKKTDDEP